jgi:xanthine dehydrogenase accessory factor
MIYEALRDALAASEPVSLATIIDGVGVGDKLLVGPDREPLGGLGHDELDRVVTRDALGELEHGRSGVRHYGTEGQQRETEVTVFIESFAPPPLMLVFGAVDFTKALAEAAKVVGYKVIVADAREVFATAKRFPMADEVIVSWPDGVFDRFTLTPRDAVCILTHDTKFDVPAVVRALETDVGYIGVMGSRRTHEKRVERLREVGVDDAGLAKLMAPIGIDIGSRTPEETAVSILAEIIAVRSGRDVPQLRDGEGSIH